MCVWNVIKLVCVQVSSVIASKKPQAVAANHFARQQKQQQEEEEEEQVEAEEQTEQPWPAYGTALQGRWLQVTVCRCVCVCMCAQLRINKQITQLITHTECSDARKLWHAAVRWRRILQQEAGGARA